MNLSTYYWYFTSVIPPRVCDNIITHGLSKPESMARTGGYDNKELSNDEIKNLQKKRKSDLVWLDDTWIYRELHPYIHIANRNAGWNFEWSRSESLQFTKYKLNQYYDWHCDSWDKPYDKKNINHPEHGKVRKLSMTCQLTDGSEYEGGELEFDFRNYDPPMNEEKRPLVTAREILPKGSIIVFPSFVWHRVRPVTSGTRYSLVTWSIGNPFK